MRASKRNNFGRILQPSSGSRGFAVIAGLLLWLGLAFAPAVLAQADAPALWKISGPRGNVYFFGSFHMLPPDVKWRTPALLRALDEAKSVVLESDRAALQDPQAMQALIVRFGLLPSGQTLSGVLGPRVYAELEAAATEVGFPAEALAPMRPWFAAMMLSVQSIARLGYDPDAGVDAQIAQWAAANGKALLSLETNETQFRVFADLTPEQEAQFMALSLRDIREAPKALQDMLAAYRRGDAAAIEKTVNAGLDEFPVLRQHMFKARHDKWLPQIEKMIAQGGGHVIVVGAGHLVGPDSVVALLRAKGVRIEGP
jgi:uncharacterized protein